MEIKKILEKQTVSLEELILCFESIKENGDVAVIKFDGERVSVGYTVFITFPSGKREMIRSDDSTLREALQNVLYKYING